MADKHYWTWRGKYFGYRVGDDLFTHRGRHAGRFYGDEVYGVDGQYLGEEKNDGRLITNKSKQARKKGSIARRRGASYVKYVNYVGYVMYAGHEDFPGPQEFVP
ncbi:hypothetical protein ACFW4Q_24540 [Streptomyces rochei]|uniref:hypothetical protein n=1 Tax=Streptomyces rochei TaxID=1928 RepID=UPI003678732D